MFQSSTRIGLILLTFLLWGCSNQQTPLVDSTPATIENSLETTPVTPVTFSVPSTDWHQWGGPNGNGILNDSTSKVDWNAEPKIQWRHQIGLGYSNVAVVDQTVHAYGHTDGKETLFALDLESGQVQWQQSVESQLMDNLHKGGPGGTPLVSGSTIVVLSKQGDLHARNVSNGELLWTVRLPEAFELETPEWGFTGAPVLLDSETLIIECGVVAALSLKTGETLWKTEKHDAGYGAPIVFEHEAQTLIAYLNNEALQILDAEQGTVLSEFPWKTKFKTSATTPLILKDQFFISTGYNRGCTLLNWNDQKLEQVYETKTLRAHMTTPLLLGEAIYGIDGNSHSRRTCQLVCINAQTGERNWEERGFGCGSLIAVNDVLIVLSDKGELVIAKADPTQFAPLNRLQVLEDDKIWTAPVFAQGQVLCRGSSGELVCVDFRPSI